MIHDGPLVRIAALVLVWLLYFVLHTLLASLRLKRRVAREHSRWMPAYRLVYNVLALLLLIPPLVLTYLERGPWLWQWTGVAFWIANGIAALAVVGSRIEERKLIQYHGDVYRRYRKLVPGLIPSRRRFLSSEQARRLLSAPAEKPWEIR